MNEQADPRQRRQFLKTGLLAASTVALGPTLRGARAADEQQPSAAAGIPTRPFGRTGHTLPILGMGGSAMVAQWVASYGVPLLGTDERVAMVRHAFDRGIRYFDTARVYAESESIMGKGLKGVRDQLERQRQIDPKLAGVDILIYRNSLYSNSEPVKQLKAQVAELGLTPNLVELSGDIPPNG